jgi:hypothetical protein
VRRRDVKAADVVQRAIVRFADQCVDRSHVLVARLRHRPPHDGVDGHADGERVGEDDRRLDRSELLHLRRARELAERIADEHRAGDLFTKEVAGVRHDRRDAGPHRIAADDRRVANPHARDIGDGVQRTGRQRAGRDAEIARARTAGLRDERD